MTTPTTTTRAPFLAAALLVAMLASITASPATEARPRPHPAGNLEYGRLTVDEGPTWPVIYIGRGDPRRVILPDGRTGILNCRAHTFTVDRGPSYYVDC